MSKEELELKEFRVLSIVTKNFGREYIVYAYNEADALEQVEAGDVDINDEWEEDSNEYEFEAKEVLKDERNN